MVLLSRMTCSNGNLLMGIFLIRFNHGRGPVPVKNQPTITEERCALAQRLLKDFKMNVEFLVDDPEKYNPFEKSTHPGLGDYVK